MNSDKSIDVSLTKEYNQSYITTLKHYGNQLKKSHPSLHVRVNCDDMSESTTVKECSPVSIAASDFEKTDEATLIFYQHDNKLSDECILIQSEGQQEPSAVQLSSLTIHYHTLNQYSVIETQSYASLPSALTEGLDSLTQDSQISLTSDLESSFYLPLLPHNNKDMIVPKDSVYFFCLKGVKNATVALLTETKK